jgi:DME family drug/metabolite transporter
MNAVPGEVYAVACAFLWALGSALLKSQTHKVSTVALGALRSVPAVLIYWVLLLVTGRITALPELPLRSWVLLAASTLIGLVIGDLLYFRSMKLIGLSRAMPLSATYPFFTIVLALLFLDEQLDWTLFAGAALIAVGAYLLAFPRGIVQRPAGQGTGDLKLVGVALALLAAMCWSASTVLLGKGLEGVDVLVANAVRLTVLILILWALLFRRGGVGAVRGYGLRTLSIVFLAGIIGTGLGTFTFLAAVKLAGAAKTSILTAATPVFGVPFSLFLGERVSARMILGTVLTVTGVWLTII